MDNRIIVIGGSGFIGTRLCERLLTANRDVVILDKVVSEAYPEICQIADVRSADGLREHIRARDVIVNLAAEHRDDVRPRSLYDDVNVEGARNVCRVAREKRVSRIVFTSSVAVYGFAPPDTDETGNISPFNDYGRTKYEAEQVFRAWQQEDPQNRMLAIVRPTVVFGERNRGNVYNLLRQIASGRFVMVGNGENRKSMAYVENVAAFLERALAFEPGEHLYNFIDKPDFTMNALVSTVRTMLGKPAQTPVRLPFAVGYAIGKVFDLAAALTGRNFPISSIRVQKFCVNSAYATSLASVGFRSPVPLDEALRRTVRYEFVDARRTEHVFYTE